MLIYSELLGLRDQAKIPRTLAPDTYVREFGGWVVSVHDRRIRHGPSLHWVTVKFDQLPTRLKLEALVLGIQL